MASLSPPFILCPLSDRQALLGIRPDQSVNKAIVTLGKNIAIRYHILDQKQECSWTTSRYWFTSPVSFCHDFGKYVAVLNHKIVALWDEEDSTLANINKIKLPETVYGLSSKPHSRTVAVLTNGRAVYLSDVVENKSLAKDRILEHNETVTGFEVDEENNLCYLITKQSGVEGKERLSIVVTSIEGENEASHKTKRYLVAKHRNILGLCIVFTELSTCVAYFGSDGYLYKKDLSKTSRDSESMKLTDLDKSISSKNPVTMCTLADTNNSHLAIYGCDPSEEGAVVLIYDIQYDVVVSKQSLKLYSVPPLMEKVGQSLLVPLGLHILVLGFRITKSLLASVVGKHQARSEEEVFEERNPWGKVKGWGDEHEVNENINFDNKDADLKVLKDSYPSIWETIQQVKIFETEGQPEAIICNHVIPVAIEKGNGEALDWILNTFLDIPEVHLVSMVIYSLQDVTLEEDESCSISERLNSILIRKFDKHLLAQSLRHVAYDDVKNLLVYLNNLLKNHWPLSTELEDGESPMTSWLTWCSTLLDAHYIKFVLHSDTKLVESLLTSVSDCTDVLKDVQEMEPFLMMTHSKTSFEPVTQTLSRWRTETVIFE